MHQWAQLQGKAIRWRLQGHCPPEGPGICLPPAGLSDEHGCLYCQGRVGKEEKEEKNQGGAGQEEKNRTRGCVQKQPQQLTPGRNVHPEQSRTLQTPITNSGLDLTDLHDVFKANIYRTRHTNLSEN